MRPLSPDDLLPLDEFAARRLEVFTSHARYLARYRRVRVGPRLTLVFENRQTLWYRVQEVLRVARLGEPSRVQRELDWYNQLLPVETCLQAALLLDSAEDRSWRDLAGEHVQLMAGDAAVTTALITCRPEDRCFGLSHWLTFVTTAELRANLADGRKPAHVGVNYRDYQHRSPPLSESTRQSLLQDLDVKQSRAA
jgi:hypothetical protein